MSSTARWCQGQALLQFLLPTSGCATSTGEGAPLAGRVRRLGVPVQKGPTLTERRRLGGTQEPSRRARPWHGARGKWEPGALARSVPGRSQTRRAGGRPIPAASERAAPGLGVPITYRRGADLSSHSVALPTPVLSRGWRRVTVLWAPAKPRPGRPRATPPPAAATLSLFAPPRPGRASTPLAPPTFQANQSERASGSLASSSDWTLEPSFPKMGIASGQ